MGILYYLLKMFHSLFVFVILFGYSSNEGESSCSQTVNVIADSLIKKVAPKFNAMIIPDISTSGIKMYSITLTGLKSITRKCDIDMRFKPESTDMTVKLCLSIGELNITGMIKINLLIRKFVNTIKITLSDVDIEAAATVPLQTGGQVVVDKIDVTKMDKIHVTTLGIISGFDDIVNVLMKTKIKDLLLKIIGTEGPKAINLQLANYKI